MIMTEYYERYWQKQNINEGVATEPPSWNSDDLKRVAGFMSPFCAGQVLDLGCGDGTLANRLRQCDRVDSVTGVDISSYAVTQAKQYYPQIVFQVAVATELPFAEKSFDFIAMVEFLEHLIDVEGVLREVGRVLKPGGFIGITTTDFNFLKQILIAAFCWEKYFYPTNPHVRFFNKKTLTNILHKTGFRVIKYFWNGSYFGVMPKGQMMIAQKIRD